MEHLDGRLRTSEAGSLYFYTATAVYEIRLTAFLADNLMNSVAQQRKNVDYRAFRNVGYNKCRDAHRGRMFRLLWTFVDLKLPSAMSHAIHKIVSKERCQSYFISRRSPHLGISKDSESCASAHRCLHYAYARLIARVTFHLQCNIIHLFPFEKNPPF